MFSGFNEILLIAVVVIAILFIPRITASRNARRTGFITATRHRFFLSGRYRSAILASAVWVAFWAIYCEPWKKEWQFFAYVGIGPVLVAWGIFWVLRGSRGKSGRQ